MPAVGQLIKNEGGMIDEIEMPSRIKQLRRCPDRLIPVPWFVAWVDGKPEFRAFDANKLKSAVLAKLCWVCGEPLGRYMTFVIGPMCGVNRTSSEPPSHLECGQWSARNCPFLSNAKRKRREDDGINNETMAANAAGHAITRNPGVTLLWTTRDYKLFNDGRGGVLFNVGEPTGLEFYANGQRATREQVSESIRTGLPALREMAASQGAKASLALCQHVARLDAALDRYLPRQTQ